MKNCYLDICVELILKKIDRLYEKNGISTYIVDFIGITSIFQIGKS